MGKSLSLADFLFEAFREGGHYTRMANQMGWHEAYRPHQFAYAQHIGTALLRENVVLHNAVWPAIGLIQADTGIGKTRVLLTAAAFLSMQRKMPVVISTFTRALQHQILKGKDWKIVKALFESLFNYEPSIAVRFGRGNFISASLVQSWEEERIQQGAPSHPEWDKLVHYLESVQQSGDPLDATIAAFREKNGDQLPVIPHGQNNKRLVDADIALRPNHPESDQTFYQSHLDYMMGTPDIVLTNHHSVLLDALLDGKLFLPAPDRRAALICDEADHLHSVARNILSRRVRVSQQMRKAARIIEASIPDSSTISQENRASALEIKKSLSEKADFMDVTLNEVGESSEWVDLAITQAIMEDNADLAECIRMPETAIKMIRGFLKNDTGNHHQSALKDIVENLSTVVMKKDQMEDGDQDVDSYNGTLRFISWSPTRRYASFCEERISANWLVFKACGRNSQASSDSYGVCEHESNPCVLTSATLTSPYFTDLEHYRRENRFPALVADAQEIVEVSHFGHVSFVLPAPHITSIWNPVEEKSEGLSYNPEWTEMVSSVLHYLLQRNRRTLVLTPSFAEVSLFQDLITEENANFHTEGAFRDYWAAFLTGNQSMMMTPSAWEGFDPVQDGVTWCQDVVITRIPISPRNTLVDEERARIMAQSHAEWVKTVKAHGQAHIENLRPMTVSAALYVLQQERVARAYRRLVQGMGRGIRQAQDHCRIWILDPRMPMGKSVIEAMECSENPDVLDLIGKNSFSMASQKQFAAICAAFPPRLRKRYDMHSLWFQGAIMDVYAESLKV